ncbi:hypothetical protein [Nonomuraea turkmeniaca]|nr:hypothetical protein [Nonomuraea turkmeniaca]
MKNVGKSVSKPAWTLGHDLWMIFTVGMANPFIWLKRRKRTTITKHR